MIITKTHENQIRITTEFVISPKINIKPGASNILSEVGRSGGSEDLGNVVRRKFTIQDEDLGTRCRAPQFPRGDGACHSSQIGIQWGRAVVSRSNTSERRVR
jgi:hypothetical protein